MTIASNHLVASGTGDSLASLRDELTALLAAVRQRTLTLLAPLSNDDACLQHDPLMSPIVWDLGHIASFERLWLQEQLTREVRFGEMPGLYNPFEHPRAERGILPLPTLDRALQELERIRSATMERIATVEFNSGSPLLRDGYVYRMVAQHESQHQETILQTLQLKRGAPYPASREWDVPAPSASVMDTSAMVAFSGGAVTVGTDDTSAAYDNERPAHSRLLAPFEIDATPVTNGAYREFMDDGGYDDDRHWSDAGRAWRTEAAARAPKYWRLRDGQWFERVMDSEAAVDPLRPVSHVCYHEAEAFARWAGKRLPSEEEWETAATWDPHAGKRLYPWGEEPASREHANVDQLAFSTAPVGSYPRNTSPLGCYGMIGDVWEWTSSDFGGYPGFRSLPYPEYSEAFFGTGYKVLRGGSWATAAHVARGTFRNWDFPVRRQIFAGFRCARDA